MIPDYGTASMARESNALLSRLVSEELQNVVFDKERYDLRYPTHVKELSRRSLRAIARRRVIIRLCAPFCDADAEGCGEVLE
jgi:hypothetical protein